MKRIRWILPLALLLLAASAIAGVAQPHLGRSAGTPAGKTITVSGNGTVTSVPDRADFGFTVETRAKTAAGALAQNADAATNVIAALKKARSMRLVTVAFSGQTAGELAPLADHLVLVPSGTTARIQEMHITLGQMLCGALEVELGLVGK